MRAHCVDRQDASNSDCSRQWPARARPPQPEIERPGNARVELEERQRGEKNAQAEEKDEKKHQPWKGERDDRTQGDEHPAGEQPPVDLAEFAENNLPSSGRKGAERPAAIHLGCFLPDLTR